MTDDDTRTQKILRSRVESGIKILNEMKLLSVRVVVPVHQYTRVRHKLTLRNLPARLVVWREPARALVE